MYSLTDEVRFINEKLKSHDEIIKKVKHRMEETDELIDTASKMIYIRMK